MSDVAKKRNKKIFDQLRKYDDKRESFPSKNIKHEWVLATLDIDYIHKYPNNIPDSEQGKLLIFVREPDIDELWHKIRMLYRTGELMGGGGAKCSTQKSKSLNPEGKYVIVIYCACEKERIHNRKILWDKAGVIWKIPYKLEIDTDKKYYVNGDKYISKYFE